MKRRIDAPGPFFPIRSEEEMLAAARKDLVRFQYESALTSNFEHINKAAQYFNVFALLKPKKHYLNQADFTQNIRQHAQDLPALAKEIDGDVKCYWQNTFAGLVHTHRILCDLYDDLLSSRATGKNDPYANYKLPEKELAEIENLLSNARSKIPAYEFMELPHARYWKQIAEIYIPIIEQAREIHIRVCSVLLELNRKKLTPDQKRAIERISKSVPRV